MDSQAAELPLTDRLWNWFEENRKPALIGLLVIIVAASVAGFISWRKSQREIASSEAVSKVSVTMGMAGPGGQAALASEFLKAADSYPGSMAGARALVMAASTYFDEGKYDDARKQFERFSREYPANPLMGQVQLGIATTFDAQGKTTDALNSYKNLVERHPNDNAVPQAKLALGRIYEQQGKPELARAQYEELLRSPDSQYGSLANEAGLRLEELKWKFPSLTPPPAAPSAPMINLPTPAGSNATIQLENPPK